MSTLTTRPPPCVLSLSDSSVVMMSKPSFWKGATGQIGGELGEGNEISYLRRAVLHVRQVGQRIVAHGVVPRVAAGVADRRQVFGIGLPRLTRGNEFADNIVDGNGEA